MKGNKQCLSSYFIETVSNNKTAMYRLAYSIVLNAEDAEDVVGETILKAFSHLEKLRNYKKMKAWIFQILVNESKSYLKKRNRIELVEDSSLFIQNEGKKDTASDLLELVCQLEDSFREVLILYYFEEFSVKEIAKILTIPEGTVKSRLSRAREELKQLMESNHWKG
ncbi:MAG: RNA polymerase sigma factor [Roseburia sp.]|nr:RNA polymerase sigma factor [Roseburia sp.]MCM1279826.1 RNA polymerase sigma factor [Robinsoniella sp.]